MTDYSKVERDGMSKIIALAKALCRILSAVKHILLGKYPDSEPIFALISAIEALCPLIADAEFVALQREGDNEDILADPDSAPGINPSLPPAEAPDIA